MSKKIGLMIVGVNGAVATTVATGVELIRRKGQKPIGLLTELPEFKNVDWFSLETMKIGGWDFINLPYYDYLKKHGVVDKEFIDEFKTNPIDVKIYKAPKIGTTNHILNVNDVCINDIHIKNNNITVKEAIKKIMDDMNDFKNTYNLDGIVVGNLMSTEPMVKDNDFILSLKSFEEAIDNNDSRIQAGMIYAYAALKLKIPYFNFTPNATVGIPALKELALKEGVAVAGNDGKTGQTLYKTVIAAMLKWRNLKLEGWYSTNILGNNDGRVLEDPEHKETKIWSKTNVLEHVLGYNDFYHRVEINYYPPRGDDKEAWDNIDFRGWMGSRMSMKINLIGKDSILAAPLVIDIARILWYSQEKGDYGVAKHLSLFFKDPIDNDDHNFFNQVKLLQDYLP